MLPEGAVAIEAGGESLWLLPQRAAFWPSEATLLVADAHIGKDAAFRHAGFPVPRGTTSEDLERLALLIDRCDAARVVFLGDLVHNATARCAASAAFVAWRAQRAHVEIILVRGNHDRHAGDPAPEWNVRCVDDPHQIGALALCHIPREVHGAYAIAGHVHPAARLHGRGRDSLRLPCFCFGSKYAIMPAFGSFTGMADFYPSPQNRLFVAAGSQVIAAH